MARIALCRLSRILRQIRFMLVFIRSDVYTIYRNSFNNPGNLTHPIIALAVKKVQMMNFKRTLTEPQSLDCDVGVADKERRTNVSASWRTRNLKIAALFISRNFFTA
jgi:hypothetical protein